MKDFLKKLYASEFIFDGQTICATYPEPDVRLRLDPAKAQGVFYIPIDGKLHQCKIVKAELKSNLGVKYEKIHQLLTLNIAGKGMKTIVYAVMDSEFSLHRASIKTHLYSSVENYKQSTYINPFKVETAKEFFESIFGSVEWHHYSGSIGVATKYYWQGTNVAPIQVAFPTDITFLPDGSLSMTNKVSDYIKFMRLECYDNREDCKTDGLNRLDVVAFEDEQPAATTASTNLADRIKLWATQNGFSIDEMQKAIASL